MAKLRLGFRIKSIPEQVSVYPSPQWSVHEIYLLFVGIVVESKSTEGDGWGRFSGAAVPWAYRTIGPKGTSPERDGSYPRTFTTTRRLRKLGKLLRWLRHRQSTWPPWRHIQASNIIIIMVTLNWAVGDDCWPALQCIGSPNEVQCRLSWPFSAAFLLLYPEKVADIIFMTPPLISMRNERTYVEIPYWWGSLPRW